MSGGGAPEPPTKERNDQIGSDSTRVAFVAVNKNNIIGS